MKHDARKIDKKFLQFGDSLENQISNTAEL